MLVTYREVMTALHGMGLGAIFLLLFSAIVLGLNAFEREWLTPRGRLVMSRLLGASSALVAAALWLTVIVGTFVVYPWYRMPPVEGAPLLEFPRSFLLSKPELAPLHSFGMEWKEHVAWLSPILATAVAYVLNAHADLVVRHVRVRWAVSAFLWLAFAAAAVAALLGAWITKAAPLR